MATVDKSLTVPVLLAISTLQTVDDHGVTEVNLDTLKALLENLSDVIDEFDQQYGVCSDLHEFFTSQKPATYAKFVDFLAENEICVNSFLLNYNSSIRRSIDPKVKCVNEQFFRTLVERSHELEMLALLAEERSDRVMQDRNKLDRVIELMEKKVVRKVFFDEMKLLGIDLTTQIDVS